MKHAGFHGETKKPDLSSCSLLPEVTAKFLNSQVNKVFWMLQRTCGKIPLPPNAIDRIKELVDSMESIRTFGGLVVDATGFGKTLLRLLFLSLRNKLVKFEEPYKPTMVVAPSGVVLAQWITAINTHFPRLAFVVGYGDKPPSSYLADRWVSGPAMRAAPSCMKLWLKKYRYAFKQDDTKTASLVILTTYATFTARTLYAVIVKKKERKEKERDRKTSSDPAGRGVSRC